MQLLLKVFMPCERLLDHYEHNRRKAHVPVRVKFVTSYPSTLASHAAATRF